MSSHYPINLKWRVIDLRKANIKIINKQTGLVDKWLTNELINNNDNITLPEKFKIVIQ